MIEQTSPAAKPPREKDSAAPAYILLVAIWIAGLSFVLYPLVWLGEQIALASGDLAGYGPSHRMLWSGIITGHALTILLTSALGLRFFRKSSYRPVFKTWILAGVFALLALPVQFVTPPAAQLAALLQIVGATVYLLILAWLRRRSGVRLAPGGGILWPALLAATLIIWPWFIWGALGSLLDTILNLASAILFGLAAGQTSHYFLNTKENEEIDKPPFSLGPTGLIMGIAWLTMGAAYGYNGQQLILLGLLSGIGWLAAAVSRWDAEGARYHDWRATSLLVGLVVAAPLAFVDPDELLLLLNMRSRDALFFTFQSTALGIAATLLLTIPFWLLARRPIKRRRWLTIGVAIFAVAGLGALYFTSGQPGWSGDHLYVIMANQADLTAAAGITDPIERRTFVYNTLVAHADETQADLRQALTQARIHYTPYYLENALEVDGGPATRRWLEARPDVDRVLMSPVLRPLPGLGLVNPGTAKPPTAPEWNLVKVGAPQVWEKFDVRGAGIIIGQSDSGVDAIHPELRDQYRGNKDGATGGDSYNWFDPWFGSTHPIDYEGHGTHTLGTVLGRTVGVAPEATWIGCVNLARNLGNPPRYLDCLQFMLAPFPSGGDPFRDGRPDLGANVLNNSWGCPALEGCDPGTLLSAVRALRAAGVFVVASAGNDGPACNTINAPISLFDEVFTVGAMEESGWIADFSSRGPVTADGSGRTKPDVVAPGADILSSYPHNSYDYASGTSMAGPHVVGVVALLWSADPSLIGDIDRTEALLTSTALHRQLPADTDYCGTKGEWPNNIEGYGLVNAYVAMRKLIAEDDE